MTGEAKAVTAIGIVTLLIIVGGVLISNNMGKTASSNTPVQKVDSNLLIRDDSNKISTDSAKVTLVEFGDFQCPACAAYHPEVKKIINSNKDKLNFVFRNFPLSQHQNALVAAEAAEAAGEQGKYWEMYDILYEKQNDWAESRKPLDLFSQYAKDIKLDVEKFKKAVNENKFSDKINKDKTDGTALGVTSTPTFYINSEKFSGSPDDLETRINVELKK